MLENAFNSLNSPVIVKLFKIVPFLPNINYFTTFILLHKTKDILPLSMYKYVLLLRTKFHFISILVERVEFVVKLSYIYTSIGVLVLFMECVVFIAISETQ